MWGVFFIEITTSICGWLISGGEVLVELRAVALRKIDLQAMFHVHGQSELWSHRVMFHHPHAVAIDDGGCHEFHLVIGKVFA